MLNYIRYGYVLNYNKNREYQTERVSTTAYMHTSKQHIELIYNDLNRLYSHPQFSPINAP